MIIWDYPFFKKLFLRYIIFKNIIIPIYKKYLLWHAYIKKKFHADIHYIFSILENSEHKDH